LKFQLRLDANNFPFKQPQFSNPSATYNANDNKVVNGVLTNSTFGRMTGTRGSFSDIGTGNANMLLVGKIMF
jgi:hypothetical protein